MRRWSGHVRRVEQAARRTFHCSSRASHRRISVAELLHHDGAVGEVEVNGWVRSVRKQKRVAFAVIGDGSTIDPLQAVLKPEQATEISAGTAVKLHGSWHASAGSKQSHELQVAAVHVLGDNDAERCPIQPKFQTQEYLRSIPHLRPRIPVNALLLRLRSQVIASLTGFFDDRGFVQTHTPVITSSDCEGAGEVFIVSANPIKAPPRHGKPEDGAQDDHFFRNPKYLTVSAQLHLEALAQAVSKVWTLSPTFRAEKSDTPRHLSEFYMLEAELCFAEDLAEVMDLVENMLRVVATRLTSSKVGSELLAAKQTSGKSVDEASETHVTADILWQRWTGMSAPKWPRITYDSAIELLQRAVSQNQIKFVFEPLHKDGLQAEHERYLATTVGQGKPVFVTDYPREQKPFYMPPSASTMNSKGSTETAACFDLLVPDLCELAGGSLRESRADHLLDSMQAKGVTGSDLEWYQDLRRYGSVPHGGFGLGFDRLLCYLGGVTNVRDVVAFPRWKKAISSSVSIEVAVTKQGFSTIDFGSTTHIRESRAARTIRETRQSAVKSELQRCWTAYRDRAWLRDELLPQSGGGRDTFGGWAATLVDTLDTLWIAGMRDEFYEAVSVTASIDFSLPSEDDSISLFETTIRYLGGLLAAYDLSSDQRCLQKATELGQTLYAAFDTPNRLPVGRFDAHLVSQGGDGRAQRVDYSALLADIGSLTLEFTRLAQLTGEDKWYDAVARIVDVFDEQQNMTDIPGLWPGTVYPETMNFSIGVDFSLGAMSDSMYEYLPKMYALLGGSAQYERMYQSVVDATITHMLFRPMMPGDPDILLPGHLAAHTDPPVLRPEMEHLACFLGGMFALGGRLMANETHVAFGRKLTDGCIHLYRVNVQGIMPEDMTLVPCANTTTCPWDETLWHAALESKIHQTTAGAFLGSPTTQSSESYGRHDLAIRSLPLRVIEDYIALNRLPAGFTSITNRHYILRPEAIESVLILYRLTGDPQLLDDGWRMFESITAATRSEWAHSGLSDVTDPAAPKLDEMQSFWTAETLKYFYLLFSEPGLVSLDEFVFNTEAHPFRRPRRKKGFWG